LKIDMTFYNKILFFLALGFLLELQTSEIVQYGLQFVDSDQPIMLEPHFIKLIHFVNHAAHFTNSNSLVILNIPDEFKKSTFQDVIVPLINNYINYVSKDFSDKFDVEKAIRLIDLLRKLKKDDNVLKEGFFLSDYLQLSDEIQSAFVNILYDDKKLIIYDKQKKIIVSRENFFKEHIDHNRFLISFNHYLNYDASRYSHEYDFSNKHLRSLNGLEAFLKKINTEEYTIDLKFNFIQEVDCLKELSLNPQTKLCTIDLKNNPLSERACSECEKIDKKFLSDRPSIKKKITHHNTEKELILILLQFILLTGITIRATDFISQGMTKHLQYFLPLSNLLLFKRSLQGFLGVGFWYKMFTPYWKNIVPFIDKIFNIPKYSYITAFTPLDKSQQYLNVEYNCKKREEI